MYLSLQNKTSQKMKRVYNLRNMSLEEQKNEIIAEILRRRSRRTYDTDDEGTPAAAPSNLMAAAPSSLMAVLSKLCEFSVPDNGSNFKLTHFSDEILYEMFKHLNAADLHSLMHAHQRFHALILDRRFWINIDSLQKPLPLDVLEQIAKNCNSSTKSIKFQGMPTLNIAEVRQFNQTLSNALRVICSELVVLELKSVILDFHALRITDYPAKLKRLVFDNCKIFRHDGHNNIFSGIDISLMQLEELAVENCGWMEPSNLVIFSNIANLRWLSLKGCTKLKDIAAHANKAAQHGFKKLEYLDLSFTPLTGLELQCFQVIASLKELRHVSHQDDQQDEPPAKCVRLVEHSEEEMEEFWQFMSELELQK